MLQVCYKNHLEEVKPIGGLMQSRPPSPRLFDIFALAHGYRVLLILTRDSVICFGVVAVCDVALWVLAI